MKRIILQHWSGTPGELERASWASIAAYAKRIGVEHSVLRGTPMGPTNSPQMQKLHMLSADYDAYDTVMMVDSDMFARRGLKENIFSVPGIGVCTPLQQSIRGSLHRKLPHLFDSMELADYYGGALYKFERADRQNFRQHMTPSAIDAFDRYEFCCDEGVVHYLATMTSTKNRGLPDGEMWACSSFDPMVSRAKFVHIRRRVKAGNEERRPKMQAFRRLVGRGVLAPWT